MNTSLVGRFLCIVSVLGLFVHPIRCNANLNPSQGLQVTVDPATGNYSVAGGKVAWKFSGTVGSALTDFTVTNGLDANGSYSQESFHWSNKNPFIGTVRSYAHKNVVTFSIESVDALQGPTPDFPSFNSFPSDLHHLSFQDGPFSPPTFGLRQNATPWILFDNNGNTAILSSASDFIVSQMHGNGKDVIAAGLNSTLSSVPAGFTHTVIITIGTGIESTFHRWGDYLTAISAKSRPTDSSDPMLKYLGYWTDNGATYYYQYDQDKGYAGTVLAVNNEFESEGIPLHYMQLDSWWYQKSRVSPDGKLGGPKNAKLPEGTWNAYGGTLDYSASPALFPSGLDSFDQQLGLPLAVHGRWIDPESPYHQKYAISGIAPTDSSYWNDRASYMKQSGVFCYEQDWLSSIYQFSPQMATDLTVGNSFADGMANATKSNGMTMQYCMATPRFFLQGSRYGNLTTIRTSGDRFEARKWNDFLYTSIFADSLHIRPWSDVFMSTEVGNLLLADLSTGPVGVGDKIGSESTANLLKVIRPDGVIVRPDAPLLPTDSTIISDANMQHRPLIASTYTDNGARTAYVFAYQRTEDSDSVMFRPSELGLTGNVAVKTVDGTVIVQPATTQFQSTIGPQGWSYFEVAPIGKSGIAFFGDTNKFVGNGRARISSLDDRRGKLDVMVNYVDSEKSVELVGYSKFTPTASAAGGMPIPVQYDTTSGLFTVSVDLPSTGTAHGDLKQSNVTFSTR